MFDKIVKNITNKFQKRYKPRKVEMRKGDVLIIKSMNPQGFMKRWEMTMDKLRHNPNDIAVVPYDDIDPNDFDIKYIIRKECEKNE